MRTRSTTGGPAFIVAFAICLAFIASMAWAQAPAAVISSMTGQVDVMAKGETAWVPARVGMQVFEGANVRAMNGANAELRLPDGSTLAVAENTRFVVTKLDFDNQNRMKSSFFHLAAGKLRGVVAKAAVTLIQTQQQSNFAITTPTAVAAVRGTTLYASFNPATNQTTFLVTDGIAIIRDMAGNTITLRPGQITTISTTAPPTPPANATPAQVNQMSAAANPAEPGVVTVLTAPTVVSVPAETVIVQMATAPTAPAGTPAVVVSPAPPPPTTRPYSPSR